MLGLLSVLMGMAKLASVVWAQVVSMEILPTEMPPILPTIMHVLPTGILPILTSMNQGVEGLVWVNLPCEWAMSANWAQCMTHCLPW